MLSYKALTESVRITNNEMAECLEIFQRSATEYPSGRLDAIDNMERLVMIRRAVAAGFYNENLAALLDYCTGCVPCPGRVSCDCDCHSYP